MSCNLIGEFIVFECLKSPILSNVEKAICLKFTAKFDAYGFWLIIKEIILFIFIHWFIQFVNIDS